MPEQVHGFFMWLTSFFTVIKPYLLQFLLFLPKVLFAILGAVLALILSGDIKKDGTVIISRMLIFRFFMAVMVSLTGGAAFIEYFDIAHYSKFAQGFIYLIFAVFGMLVIGIFYQSLALLEGKSFAEVFAEIKDAFFAIFGR